MEPGLYDLITRDMEAGAHELRKKCHRVPFKRYEETKRKAEAFERAARKRKAERHHFVYER